jgi:DNA-binding HxlR family transcriptional regulator
MAERHTQKEAHLPSESSSEASAAAAQSSEEAWAHAIAVIRDINVFDEECGAHQVIARLGNKWSLLVIYSLVQGTKRYTELQKQIKNISPKMLTQVLRNLEKDGLVSRAVHPVVPPMVEYMLTPLGTSLAGPLAGLCVWAEENDAILKKTWRLKSD